MQLIVCLGWGSLIWDPRTLPVVGGWEGDGPALPVEFSRVSSDGRLTLSITQGAMPLPTLWTALALTTVDSAVVALGEREKVSAKNHKISIGFWSKGRSSRHNEAALIGEWAKQRGCEGVVWTALKPGLSKSSRGTIPSQSEVLAYLESAPPEVKCKAEEYVRRAPVQIATRYRAAIEQEFGWLPA